MNIMSPRWLKTTVFSLKLSDNMIKGYFYLSNPNHQETEEEKRFFEDIKHDVIDVEPEELIEVEDIDNIE